MRHSIAIASPRSHEPSWNPVASVVLVLLLFASSVASLRADAVVTLAWDPSNDPAVTGYRVHFGLEPGNYSASMDAGNEATATIEGLETGLIYFFAATAYTADGLESGFSNEVSHQIPVPPLPEIVAPTPQTIEEGNALEWTVEWAVESDSMSNWTFFLGDDAPVDAWIDPVTGRLGWVPTEDDGGTSLLFHVIARNLGTDPVVQVAAPVEVNVLENNDAPVIGSAGNRVVREGDTLVVEFDGFDIDRPAQALRYRLEGAVPGGAAIDPVRGLFSWTPSEIHGPGEYSIEVVIEDDGQPKRHAITVLHVSVVESNSPPRILTAGRSEVDRGDQWTLAVEAWDADLPAQSLHFRLGSGAPAGVSIDATTGLLTWTPGSEHDGDFYEVSVIAEDDGHPAMSTEVILVIDVRDSDAEPGIIDGLRLEPSGDAVVTVRGSVGAEYRVEASGDLRTWKLVRILEMETARADIVDPAARTAAKRFYRVRLVQ